MCRLTANQGLIKVIDQHSTVDALSSHAPKFVALWSSYEKAMNAKKAAAVILQHQVRCQSAKEDP